MDAVSFIKDNIMEGDVVKYLEDNGAKGLEKIGDGYRCSCPIHKGNNTTSFVYNPVNNLWVCHSSCGGGDVFTLVAHINELDVEKEFPKVVVLTAKEFNVNISGLELGEVSISYKSEMLKWCRYALKGKEVYNSVYDLNMLGIRYKINDYRGMNSDDIERFGVFYSGDYNRIGFTIYNELSEPVGASLRAVDDVTKPKWLHRPKALKTGQLLYNLNNIKGKFEEVYIVEGMMDCIALCKLGIENVVCTFGARITKEQLFLLMNNFNNIILLFDNDDGGHKATKSVVDKYSKVINIEVMLLKDVNDPGDIKTIEEFNSIKRIKAYEYKRR